LPKQLIKKLNKIFKQLDWLKEEEINKFLEKIEKELNNLKKDAMENKHDSYNQEKETSKEKLSNKIPAHILRWFNEGLFKVMEWKKEK
jgi:ElaB/YqjD/DUF883 family membrane-anchored ribosome-binding protein